MQQYDVIIIGAGPAGLAAALYSARSKLKTLYIEKLTVGGQVTTTEEIENYPGFAQGVTGPELSKQMEEQVQRFHAEKLAATVQSIELDGTYHIVTTNRGDFRTKAVIIASGAAPKLLGVPGEMKLRARGVSYCATCDAAFYEGANIMVVGGGDSAVEEACYLTKFADKVTLVHRRGSLRATKIAQERAQANPKLEFIWNTVIQEIQGDDMVQKVILQNVLTGQINEMPIDGIFVYVGIEPNTEFIRGKIELTEQGYIKTDDYMRTNIAGIYAVGDVRHKLLRQVITAVGDGATAAYHAEKYIEDNFPQEDDNH
jgi:thioredoxin reductase (NADPH)